MNYKLERGDKTATVESPRELSPQELSTLADQYFGAAPSQGQAKGGGPTPAAPKASPATSGDDLSPLVGGVLDTLGLTKRPGARTPVDVVLNPQGVPEHLASMAVTAPAIAAGGGAGAVLKIPSVLGRIATAGGLGALSAGQRGESMGWTGLLDAAVAGITEGATKAVTSVPKLGLKAMGSGVRAFEHATEAPGAALEFIRSRLPQGKWINAPTLGSAKLTAEEAVTKLAKMTGDAYRVARQEIADNFSRLDVQRVTGPKPYAGSVFKALTEPKRFDPKLTAKAAEAARRGLDASGTRAALDTLATQDIGEGIPAAAYPLAQGQDTIKSLLRRVVPGL